MLVLFDIIVVYFANNNDSFHFYSILLLGSSLSGCVNWHEELVGLMDDRMSDVWVSSWFDEGP